MGEWRDFALPDGSYSDETRPWTQQDVCNYLPTFAEGEGTRSRLKLATAPGLRLKSVVGTGPHRGARDVEGKRFVVSGNKLYQVPSSGIPVELGTIPGTRRVSMTHNQIAGGNQLGIATGDNFYVWDTVAETLTATGIPLLFVDFVNQLFVGVDVARRFWRYSGLADGTSWNTLDNESAEASPDRVAGLIVSQGEVLIFGERTIEVWSNSPTDTTAFQRTEVIEKGCANGNTVCRLDNTVFFVGDDRIPYRLNGYVPVPIASKAISTQLGEGDPDKLFANTYEDRGYVIYYITAQDGRTWGYDVTCQRWHRRESFGLDRWRINTLFKWNGAWWAGDYSNGNLYLLEWGLVYEGDDIFPRSVRSGVMHNDGNRVFIHALKLFADTGAPSRYSAPPDDLSAAGNVNGGIVGDSNAGSYTATGGIPGYSYAVTSGAFPAGLTLAENGSWSGAFTTAGSYSWVVTVMDSVGNAVTVADGATVAEPAGYSVVGARTSGVVTVASSNDWAGASEVTIMTGVSPAVSQVCAAGGYVFAPLAGKRAAGDGVWGAFTAPNTSSVGTGTSVIYNTALAKFYCSDSSHRISDSASGATFSGVQTVSKLGTHTVALDSGVMVSCQDVWSTVSNASGAGWTAQPGYLFGNNTRILRDAATDGVIVVAIGKESASAASRIAVFSGGAWSNYACPFDNVCGIRWANGTWVIRGVAGEVMWSDTAASGSWTAADAGFTCAASEGWPGMDASGSLFVMCDSTGALYESSDGKAWSYTGYTSPSGWMRTIAIIGAGA